MKIKPWCTMFIMKLNTVIASCIDCYNYFLALLCTVEPLNKGHLRTAGHCPLFRGCPLLGGFSEKVDHH